LRELINSWLDSDRRIVRTMAALIFAPGELTEAFLAGHRRRYFAPFTLGLCAFLLFSAISVAGSLRPRPDRALTIGTDHTAESFAGLIEARPVNATPGAGPNIVGSVATMMNFVPMLWFPLLTFGVIAMSAVVLAFSKREDRAEIVFGAHFVSWFVLWWGLGVPLLLYLTKLGFEYAAAWNGVTQLRYTAEGDVEGMSRNWNALRNVAVTPAFHSALIALGLFPWAVAAFRRAFSASWVLALIAGLLVTAVPLILLDPFG
jgi:hypothetical protein